MQNEWNMWMPIQIDVLIYHKSVPVVHCKTRDIGHEGMFVESGPLMYVTNTLLEVEFADHVSPKWHKLPMRVVHNTQEGLELIIADQECEAASILRRMVTNYDTVKLDASKSDQIAIA